MYSNRVSVPKSSPRRANAVFTENVSASVKETAPPASPSMFWSGAPPMIAGELPSRTDSGVSSPLSSAAAAVTTLNVEPGW